jgi:GTP-binding protein
LVDAKTGLLPQDKQLSLFLKKNLSKTGRVILVANKTDGPKERKEIAEFNKLSLDEPVPVSAVTGSGTGDLLDIIIKKLKTLKGISLIDNQQATINNLVNVCILGKPNVGKSSLINALLGEERIIVTPVPHTTREPQDTQISYQGQTINLIDTAGISKQGQKTARKLKQKTTLEKLSIAKSLKALARADIALLIIDINKELSRQDAKLAQEIIKRKVSLIIIANKWDLAQDRNTKKYTEYIYSYLPFVSWAPIQFTSALTGEKINKILSLITRVAEQRKTQIKENALSKFLLHIIKKHRPTKGKGTKRPHLSHLKQTATNPPKFSIQIGAKDSLRFSYIKFMENRLREKFDFLGTPITIKIIKKT